MPLPHPRFEGDSDLLCWVVRGPRLSTLVTDFFLLLTGTPSLTMRRRGDGSKEGGGEFGVTGPRDGGVYLGAWALSCTPGSVP